MSTTSGSLADQDARSSHAHGEAKRPSRRTVDAPTRAFHWLLALSFTGAYVTAEMESLRLVHVTFGYSVAGLIVARLVWGLMGPRPARLSSWASRLRPIMKARLAEPRSSIGALRPALGMLAIVGIVLTSVAAVSSGIAMDQEWGGKWLEDAFEAFHELAGNAMLAMVLGHLTLLAMGVLLKGPAQIRSMVTGRMPGAGPDLVKRNRIWLAAILISAVLAFWGWQWQSHPLSSGAGMGDGSAWTSGDDRGHHHDDDDD